MGRLAAESIPADKEFCQRETEATDREIDAFLCGLCVLSQHEIKIVDEQARRPAQGSPED